VVAGDPDPAKPFVIFIGSGKVGALAAAAPLHHTQQVIKNDIDQSCFFFNYAY
jgi:hypothetical protein